MTPLFYSCHFIVSSQCGVSADRTTRGREVPGSNFARATGFFPQVRNLSALLGGPVRWECSLGRDLTTVRPQGALHSIQL